MKALDEPICIVHLPPPKELPMKPHRPSDPNQLGKHIADLVHGDVRDPKPSPRQKAALARAAKLTPRQRSEIARKAANARWHPPS